MSVLPKAERPPAALDDTAPNAVAVPKARSGGRLGQVALVAIVAYALAARLVIALTVPPWQGPDEPKHFEAARVLLDGSKRWLAEGRYPGEHDESIPLQREVLASMARAGFWRYAGQPTPNPLP